MTMKFKLNGKWYTLTKDDLEHLLRGHNPPRITIYWVQIGRRRWPIKDAIAIATGVPPANFYTYDAYRILKGMGFVVQILVAALADPE
jgi:5-methylcytosine-specific restriction protein B